MKRVIRLLPLWIFFLGFGCNKTPEGILPLNKMKFVFLHHIMAEEMVNNYIAHDAKINYDSARIEFFSGVLKLHKIDSITFAKSVNYYKSDLERLKELFDSVNAVALREKDIRQQLEAALAKKKAVADSLATVDSLAKLKKEVPGKKDSLDAARDSLKNKKPQSLSKKDSIILAPE